MVFKRYKSVMAKASNIMDEGQLTAKKFGALADDGAELFDLLQKEGIDLSVEVAGFDAPFTLHIDLGGQFTNQVKVKLDGPLAGLLRKLLGSLGQSEARPSGISGSIMCSECGHTYAAESQLVRCPKCNHTPSHFGP